MGSTNYKAMAKRVFDDFLGAINFDGKEKKLHGCEYGMEKRLMFASILAKDEKKKVLDLASGRGITTFAMQRYGIDVVSTEIDMELCKNELGKVNPGHVVSCDGFHPQQFKEKSFDAITSYNFFGEGYMLGEFAKGRGLNDVFEELSSIADTIYTVDLQASYSNWFAPILKLQKDGIFEPEELKTKFERALGENWDVKYLGPLGIWIPDKTDEPGKSRIYDRIGFKFTKMKETQGDQ